MAQSVPKTVILKIKRQENPKTSPRWEEFELTWKPGMNVISAMMEIAANPVTRSLTLSVLIRGQSQFLAGFRILDLRFPGCRQPAVHN